jgi:hypothetical protein
MSLINSLGNQAVILQSIDDFNGALKLHDEVERICREIGAIPELTISLVEQSRLIVVEKKKPEEALPLIEEAYQLVQQHSLHNLEQQVKQIYDYVYSKI